MAALCVDCIDDEHLKNTVSGMPSRLCIECGSNAESAINAAELADIMAPLLQQRLSFGRTIRRHADDSDQYWEEPQGDELEYFLREYLGDYNEFLPDLLDAILDYEPYDPGDPCDFFFSGDNLFEKMAVRPMELFQQWDDASDEIQNRHRYFSPAAEKLFNELFSGLDDLRVYLDGEKRVVSTLPEGSTVFRARDCNNPSLIKDVTQDPMDPMDHVGPPPPGVAGPGRMNADGVSVLYAAQDLETAVSEIRPSIGSIIAVIQVRTTRPLKILDFHLLERAFQSIAFFDSDYDRLSERLAFIRHLHGLISRPVHPTHAHEYMITQALAEYLAYIHPEKVDGVLYKSVQREGGVNIVLFPKPRDVESVDDIGQFDIPIEYVADSLEFRKAYKVEYSLESCYEYSPGFIESDFNDEFDLF